LKLRLSLVFGKPWSQLGKEISAAEWAWYQAADRAGMVPDWIRQQQLMCVAAGIDPDTLFKNREPQDMQALYQQRKMMYGHL
jgi:hypothetical protein